MAWRRPTLNRPDRLNAWTSVMHQEVKAAMRAASDDAGVRVIVLTGAKQRGFCAGADMDALLDVQAGAGAAALRVKSRSIRPPARIFRRPIPTFRPSPSRSSPRSTAPAPAWAW